MDANTKPISLYNRLIWRNRFIATLRILVPIFGLIIFAFLLLNIIIANIGDDIKISGIRIERDLIIIEAPQYSGIMGNGVSYNITAKAASTAVGDGDSYDLSDARFDMLRPDGLSVIATAKQANYNLIEQVVKVEDEMIVNDSRGIKSRLHDVIIDWDTQILDARDNVEIIFSDGSILKSKTLVYDMQSQVWKFNQVQLTIFNNEE